MFKKMLIGVIVGLMLFAGTAFAADTIIDKKLYEFRSRSVVVFPKFDVVATGINYSENDVEKINRANPYIVVYFKNKEGTCFSYITIFAQIPVYGGEKDCDSLPDVMKEDSFFTVGHTFRITDSSLFYSEDIADLKGHIDRFWRFANKEYQEAQRP